MVLWLGVAHLLLTVAVFLAAWIILSAASSILGRLRLRRRGWRGLTELPRGFYGMHLAHIGVAVFMLGAGVVSTMEIERNLRMAPGETAEIAGYEFTFLGVAPVEGPNYDAEQGRFLVHRAGREIAELLPQKRHYRVQRQPMTQIAIDGGWRRDLMVALGDRLEDGAWTVRLYYKPMIRWIWAGAFLMAFGAALSASDRRYRLSRRRSAASLYASPA
jgi:cytochrome c-type biogenesis protein CcmF